MRICAILSVLPLLLIPTPALAGEPDAGVITHGSDQGVEVEATGFEPEDEAGEGGGGSGPSSAGSSSTEGDEIPIATNISLHNCLPVYGDTGIPVDSVIDSTGDCGAISVPAPADVTGEGTGSTPDHSELVSAAYDEMVALAPAVSIASAPRAGMTGLPTYLWLDPPPITISASASVPGLTVQAMAAPSSYRWDLGDGTTKRTATPGSPWTEDSPGGIRHVYERRGRYALTVTVYWQASWRIDGGPWMSLGTFQTTGAREQRVRQLIAMLS
jgi:hypothetical protein